MALPQNLVDEFDELVTHYPERRAALILALHRCQEEMGGWISPEVVEGCAEYFDLEPVEVGLAILLLEAAPSRREARAWVRVRAKVGARVRMRVFLRVFPKPAERLVPFAVKTWP